ncbi:MAG: hypothetical protein ACTHL5_13135 [Rhodanobacter sp.]
MRALDGRKFLGARALLACLSFGALLSVLRGQDANWDLKNYHLYNAWAGLHGRLTLDLAPAGLQSFFNPLLDMPYFLLGTGPLQHWPRLLAAVQGLWYGGLVFMLFRVAIRLAALRGRTFGWADVWAVLIGVTGTMTVSQTGSSFNELPLALFTLSSLYVLLPLCADTPPRPSRRALLAGLLSGLAAGLKPTAVVYAPALVLGLLLALGMRRQAWRLALLFGLGALAGFVLAYGWWGWQLYELTGNPIFPLFNQVFHSPWAPAVGGTDRQYLPRDLGQWLFYPLYWLGKNQHLVTEVNFADARYALAGLATLALVSLPRLLRRRPVDRSVRLLLVFVTTAYVLWLCLFSILRYAVPLELLSGLLLLAALQLFTPADAAPGRWLVWAMAGTFLLLAGFSRYPGWGHVPYADVAFDVRPPAVKQGGLVLVVGQPNAYVIPFLPHAQDNRYIGLSWFTRSALGFRLDALIRERIATRAGAVYAVLRDDAGDDLPLLQRYVPGARLTGCAPVQSGLEQRRNGEDASGNLRICRVLSG